MVVMLQSMNLGRRHEQRGPGDRWPRHQASDPPATATSPLGKKERGERKEMGGENEVQARTLGEKENSRIPFSSSKILRH
jgi:hypothetical protein